MAHLGSRGAREAGASGRVDPDGFGLDIRERRTRHSQRVRLWGCAFAIFQWRNRLLLQVVYHARIAEEQGAFEFGDFVAAITEKLIRRHPHVFGGPGRLTAQAVDDLWDRIKAEEKAAKSRAQVAAPGRG